MVLDFGILSSSLFPTSAAAGEGMEAVVTSQIIWKDVGIGIVPIGSVIAWHKNMPGVPPLLPNFIECNGQVIAEGQSPMNGQTVDNLNGDARFLRGSATSGTEQAGLIPGNAAQYAGGGVDFFRVTSQATVRPVNMSVVWVMRIY